MFYKYIFLKITGKGDWGIIDAFKKRIDNNAFFRTVARDGLSLTTPEP